MDIDEIDANIDIVMTSGLMRLFEAAGCEPTECHACLKYIDEGDIFKLVPHEGNDEMCCAKCGEPELMKRDKRIARDSETRRRAGHGGYSRPNKNVVKGS